MTRDELEKEARNVADLVRVEIRHHFQIRRPHYTPPPWENPGGSAWVRWRDRNLAMHGLQGCQERFPTHFPSSLWDPQDPRSRPPSALDGLVVTPPSEEVLAGLDALAEPQRCGARNGGEHQFMWHCALPAGHRGKCEPGDGGT